MRISDWSSDVCSSDLGPLHQPDDAFGNARLVIEPDQHLAHGGRMFRRLEHHGVARYQRRKNVSVRQMGWKIIRPQHGKDAMRLVPDSGADSKREIGRASWRERVCQYV